MKNFGLLLMTLILCSSVMSCNSNDDDTTSSNSCGQPAIISSHQYDLALTNTDNLTINSVEIKDGCLHVNFSASGCNGNTWELSLIDSEAIMKSLPPQRNLIFSLKNDEPCEAYITKDRTFNISNLQLHEDQVWLNIANTDESVLYEY